MKKIVLTLIVFVATLAANAQSNLDSLFSVWEDGTLPDSARIQAYKDYIWTGYVFSNPDSAIVLALELLNYSEQNNDPESKVAAYQLMGVSYYLKSNYPKALEYYEHNLKFYEEIGNKKGMAKTIGNIGGIYDVQGNSSKALQYYQRSLTIKEEIGDKKGMANTIGNLGGLYNKQGDYPKALEYYQHCLNLFKEIDNKKGMANSIGNIGIIYQLKDNYPKALEYYKRSLKINEEIGDKRGITKDMHNIGKIYQEQSDYTKALEYFQLSLQIREEIGDKRGSAASLSGIGTIFKKQGDYIKTLEYCQKSLTISEEIGVLIEQKDACQCLFDSYKAMGKGNKALVYLERIKAIDDSLQIQETNKKLQQMEFAKQILADSLANLEEARLVTEAHQIEVKKKNRTRNILAGGGILVLLFAGGIYSRLRYVRKSKAIIEEEKDRSNNLLLNILPADIAEELKRHGKAEARNFERVSILFTDFKGFTAASSKLSAVELVNELNTCFEAFDGIMEKYGIEKIKTIGDAYMAASGLPIPTDNSVKNAILAAIEMQDFIGKRKIEMDALNKPAFEMRAGIHTGPVVAGIVGVKKFQYDIWGDTVNTAARMESSGEVGKVNISQGTYELLKADTSFVFEHRGKIEAKGKGEIDMYFVTLEVNSK